MTSRVGTRLLAVAVAAVLAGAACGGDDDAASGTTHAGGAPATLDGREFVVTGSEGYDLVAGTTPHVSFDGGRISVQPGCNTLGGSYELDGDELVVGELSSTEMACAAELMAQDLWFSDFLAAGTTARVAADTMTLAGDAATLTLTDRRVVEPDLPVEGTTWTLDGTVSGDAASSVPAGVVATMRIADGTATIDTGCNTGTAPVEVRVGSLFFGPLALTKQACDADHADVERLLVALTMGEPSFTVDADTLTLTNGTVGLTFTGDPTG